MEFVNLREHPRPTIATSIVYDRCCCLTWIELLLSWIWTSLKTWTSFLKDHQVLVASGARLKKLSVGQQVLLCSAWCSLADCKFIPIRRSGAREKENNVVYRVSTCHFALFSRKFFSLVLSINACPPADFFLRKWAPKYSKYVLLENSFHVFSFLYSTELVSCQRRRMMVHQLQDPGGYNCDVCDLRGWDRYARSLCERKTSNL